MALAEKLRYARQRANLTLSQVREKASIGESSVSEFENGKREPSLSQLQAMSTIYRRSLVFFLEEGPLPREIILWRQKPTDAHGVETVFLRLCEQYNNLEHWCDDHTAVRLPQADGDAAGFGYAQAEELAKQVRRDLQLGDRPGQGLLRILEEACAVKVFYMKFEPTGTAASTVSDAFGAAVLLNSGNARWRRNFDLAHEVFHLLTWRVFRRPEEAASLEPSDMEEKLAGCFARNLLMPIEAVETAVRSRQKDGKLPWEATFGLAREFDVSVEALLWQLHWVCRWPEQQTKQLVEHAKTLVPLYEERDQDKPPTWPARYHTLAVEALRRGEISIGRFAEYLEISRQAAMKYVEQEIADGEEVQVTPA